MVGNNNILPGYRLEYIELYNWGTFDGSVEKIVPGSNTSLLTGANGSGKTTIVDALLTLLVPNTKRFYNQSSGAEQKKERDETSYVLGYYGKSMEEESTEAKIQMLRKRSDFSVLLGCFFNAETRQFISLIQVRWFSNTELKRAYVVSPNKFTIKDNFSNIDSRGEWRKQLRKQYPKTEINESFTAYSDVFMHHFGMRSEKALSLFNLTVGIKVIGNLNEFIRVNMLEEGITEEEFQQLRENFQNLSETHRNIQKAEKQLEMLNPIVTQGEQYENLDNEISEIKVLQDAVKIYYPEQEYQIRTQVLIELDDELKSIDDSKTACEEEIGGLRKQETALSKSIEDNDAKRALEKLDDEIKSHEKEKARKEIIQKQYGALIQKLFWESVDTEDKFLKTKEKIRTDIKQIASEFKSVDDARISKHIEKEKISKELIELEEDIQSLRGRKSQIPRHNLQIRQSILDAVGATADEIPFIGELIKVRADEKKWEAAIESLLNSFGLCLLVPDNYLRAVNQYVNNTDLKGRVVYHKVITSNRTEEYPDIVEGSVRDKIEFKPDTIFEGWLEKRFAQQFDFICTDNQEDFLLEPKALMPSGLRKSVDRHEKDDSERRVGPQNYILGWDNKEKLEILVHQFSQKEKNSNELIIELQQLETAKNRIQERESNLKELQKFDIYSELNWVTDQQVIEQLTKQRTDLLNKASDLKELIKQLENTQKLIKEKEDKKDKLVSRSGSVGEKISVHKRRLKDIESLISQFKDVNLAQHYEKLKGFIQLVEENDPLSKLAKERSVTEQHLKTILGGKEKQLGDLKTSISTSMQKFITPSKQITDKFPDWNADTLNLMANISSLDDFEGLYTRVLEEDLPKHKQRFRSYMNDAILERVTSFKTSLDLKLEEIEQHMKDLNISLKSIDFGKHPPTYIQLLSKPTKDVTIREFKAELQSCMPNISDMALKEQDGWLEEQFVKIKDLIDKLHQDLNLRKKVIDVRNWLEFSAEESYRENGAHHRYYDSSGSLSGGEKAQFTYTVLGAAIAYQFGINHDGSQSKSFRFITVDEAFSKLDPEKSNYLMELCKQLHLQLLVVTPLDKIHIAEPYISACHYVENKNRTRSRVFNLTMDQYYKRKKEFEEISATDTE
ncbi:MAG: SbcC/MukB-like Walker B domain-containing protein [Bacteroidia bacterium]